MKTEVSSLCAFKISPDTYMPYDKGRAPYRQTPKHPELGVASLSSAPHGSKSRGPVPLRNPPLPNQSSAGQVPQDTLAFADTPERGVKRKISWVLCAQLSGSHQINTGFPVLCCILTSPVTASPLFLRIISH